MKKTYSKSFETKAQAYRYLYGYIKHRNIFETAEVVEREPDDEGKTWFCLYTYKDAKATKQSPQRKRGHPYDEIKVS